MKNNLILLSIIMCLLICPVSNLFSQEDDSYVMWESFMLTPDNTQLKVLSENMRKHNETYHNEGAFNATVFNIVSGPNSGKIVWMMGPMQFKHNDSRPSDDAHDNDWRDNVMPYVKKMHSIEYWSQDDKLSNTGMLDGDASKYPLLFVRYHEVEDGAYSVNDFFTKVSSTIKEMEGDNPWGLYYNEFRQGDLGRHIASVGFFKNWTEFDDDNNFKETFLKLHGENSWDNFLRMGESTFSNSWDEIWNYNKHLSGD
ncbi:hypothetical protein [Hanstruepera flava]|uniref:hypothetical protein n=1 Tax=Hanstruepera flava TaxID=2930218 RepID=UPI0020287CED|nr:hypothetical protein [Hanstruepera flava]